MASETDTKKIIIVAVCLGIAVVILGYQFIGGRGGRGAAMADDTWMVCRNRQCRAEFELPMSDYFEFAQEHLDPMMMDPEGGQMKGYPCPECRENSSFRAVKCEQCELVFREGAAGPQEFPDTCPQCGHNPYD